MIQWICLATTITIYKSSFSEGFHLFCKHVCLFWLLSEACIFAFLNFCYLIWDYFFSFLAQLGFIFHVGIMYLSTLNVIILLHECFSKYFMQNISREKREDDLPEGVLAVPLLKHQVHGTFYNSWLCVNFFCAGYHVPYIPLILERKWHWLGWFQRRIAHIVPGEFLLMIRLFLISLLLHKCFDLSYFYSNSEAVVL